MSTPRRVLVSLDIGRGLRAFAADVSARRRRTDDIRTLLRASILPLLEAARLPATAYLGDLAWAQRDLVEFLAGIPDLDFGCRLFGAADRVLPDDRDEEIAYLAALGRQVTGRRVLFFRGEPEDFDADLGPSLRRAGFVADSTAAEGPRRDGRIWPREPWWSSAGDDLCRPGRGDLLEIPVSADHPVREDNLDEAPLRLVPALIESDAKLKRVLGHLLEREPVAMREDGGSHPVLHCVIAMEDFLDPRTRRERFDRLRTALKILASPQWRGVRLGAFVGEMSARRTPTVVARDLENADFAEMKRAFRREGGAIDATAFDPAHAWPLDEVLAEAAGCTPLWLETSADDADANFGYTALLAPGRGFRLGQRLRDRERGREAFVLERRRTATPVAAGVARGRRAADPSLSFCIISNGARPDDVTRVIGSIRAQEIPEAEILLVGRHEGEIPDGVRFLEAAEDADAGRLGAMRNRAAAEARHDALVVLDDDILLSPGWYRALRARAAGPEGLPPVLTSRVLLPEGGRYWDHCTIGGPRGHQMLEPEEGDAFVYMTGGGAWLMRREVFETFRWCEDRAFYEGEDVDFARRVQAAGFEIAHESAMIAFHDDPKYTNFGRVVFVRNLESGPGWIEERLHHLDADAIISRAKALLRQRHYAEVADALRYLLLREPDHAWARPAWRLLEARRGGPLRGTTFEPDGCPLYLRTRAAAERPVMAQGAR